ncbi:GNAT family N-acetyltransferase [Actinoplanes xinjiangensis]|uniref:Acetyltransferase (GNAT) family protein n=1 Tax=Actinoplanes xinjiangensis TaxID=512350 RepID=A0A316F858_9ACTN|nr:GNAT family N-acetyltransferase [Actinoplanes xinjiangensis]PWK33255.1 acetyltransferase (GNAT) family protein [Actinoplanes xinjiangensis]GIF43506.1 N-acetyltransferase [Actinoplanes xinjiangensis]
MNLGSLHAEDLRVDALNRIEAVIAREPVGFVSAERYRAEMARRTFRPEWTWVAENEGRIAARAVWWGRPDGARPLLLDCLWTDPAVPDRAGLAARLLVAAHRRFREHGDLSPEAFRMNLRNDWRSDPATRDAVAWRRDAAAAVGFTHAVERLQFEWTPACGVPEADDRLVFVAEPDDEKMLEVFRRIGDGSLDDETRKMRARTSADEVARHEMDFYLSAPGERDWWRVAYQPDGALAGLAIPSATSYHPNVGYLGVVPEMRGRGYARIILAAITRSHASRGAERITATTDTANFPMAAAFRESGYRNTGIRLMLSAA